MIRCSYSLLLLLYLATPYDLTTSLTTSNLTGASTTIRYSYSLLLLLYLATTYDLADNIKPNWSIYYDQVLLLSSFTPLPGHDLRPR